MGVGREVRRAVQTFAQAVRTSKGEAAAYLQQLAGPARRRGLSEGDTFRVGADTADMWARFHDHGGAREILTSGWEAGSLKTMAGLPMHDHAPLSGVLQVADAVCHEFFPALWREYAAEDRERQIRLLQEEYATLAAVPLSASVDRIEELRVGLAQLGAEPDRELVRRYREDGQL